MKTPRTDGELQEVEGDLPGLCRQLEREAVELKKALRSVMLAGTSANERIALHNARELLKRLDGN